MRGDVSIPSNGRSGRRLRGGARGGARRRRGGGQPAARRGPGPRRAPREGVLREHRGSAARLGRAAPEGLRLDRLPAVPRARRARGSEEGRRGRDADAGLPRRRVVVRPGGAQRGPGRRGAREVRRGLGDRPPRQLPRGPHRRRRRRPRGGPVDRLRLLLGRPGGRRQDLRRLQDRGRRRVRRHLRPGADDAGLAHGDHDRPAGAAAPRAQADLRRALARGPAHRRLRQLGLRRRPGDRQGRRLPPVRRPRRPGHDARARRRRIEPRPGRGAR